MFLEDINRKIDGQHKQWQYWDRHATVTVTAREQVVDFIEGIQVFFIKNIGETDITLNMKKMCTRLKPGEEKYFHIIRERQAILMTGSQDGCAFVGQSRRENPSQGFGMIGSVLFLSIVLNGCCSMHTHPSGTSQYIAMPCAPQTATAPQTPSAPKTP